MSDRIQAAETLAVTPRLGLFVAETTHLVPATSSPANFRFGEVTSTLQINPIVLATLAPDLGPIAAFVGNWVGNGFNTIFRPNSTQTPTKLPVAAGGDNILELNLTSETLSFSPSLGSVPNRGMVQGDALLNGIPYLQSISDVTVAGQSIGIHAEPGLWMAIPHTTDPLEPPTVARMGSIPHGTTINAQGTSTSFAGKPTIPSVDITPNALPAGGKIKFPSQTAATGGTARIPQDLGPWITAGTITQAMLDDPNSVLRNHIAGQTITHTTQIMISTNPAKPILLPKNPAPQPAFGGGTDNIAFLQGDGALQKPNAQTFQMEAIFWIETVQHSLKIPVFIPGQAPLTLQSPEVAGPGLRPQIFIVTPPHAIPVAKTITFTTTQIQYSQLVILNFNGLAWPHVSVATLVPAGQGTVPSSAWA